MTPAWEVPDVTVIMPAWNAAGTIASSIESILMQASEASIEILVIDDRSDDRTRDIALSFEKRAAERGHRLRVLTNTRSKGPSGARNTGLLAATGRLLAFLDADDLWYPNHFDLGHRVLQSQPDIDAVFFNVEIRDGHAEQASRDWFQGKQQMAKMHTEPLDHAVHRILSDVIEHLIEESFIRLQSLIIRRHKVGPVLFRESIDRSEDRDFLIQVLHHEPLHLAFGEAITGLYIRHAGSLTSADRPDVGLALVRAHIVLFREYLGWADLDDRRRSVLRRKLQAAKIECSYHLRHQGDYRCALTQLFRSLSFGVQSRQIGEFFKTVLSMTLPAAFTHWVSTACRRSRTCLRP